MVRNIVTKKSMVASTEISKIGDKYLIKNPVISIETDLDLGMGLLNLDLQELVALLSIIFMKVGRESTIKLIKEVIPNAKL